MKVIKRRGVPYTACMVLPWQRARTDVICSCARQEPLLAVVFQWLLWSRLLCAVAVVSVERVIMLPKIWTC